MDLMTAEEVIGKLRLNVGRRRPDEALRNLRRTRRIGWVRVGKVIMYPDDEVERFIWSNRVNASEANNR
jgi:hypothetical protein